MEIFFVVILTKYLFARNLKKLDRIKIHDCYFRGILKIHVCFASFHANLRKQSADSKVAIIARKLFPYRSSSRSRTLICV